MPEEMYEYNTSTHGEARIHLAECGHAKAADSWNRDEPNWIGPFSSKEEVAHHAKSTGREVRVAGCCKGKIAL